MGEPEVSVVLAARNEASRLDAALDSVLSQEEVDLELIVVDDGSTDQSAALLAARAGRDPRLRVLAGAGEGLSVALQLGCARARAPVIARQDAGDRSLPGRLRRQLEAFSRWPELALASCFSECLAPGGEHLYVERGRAEPDRERSLFEDPTGRFGHVGPTAHGTAMFRREHYERVGGYRAEFPLAQDWDLWLRLGEVGTYVTVGAVLYQRWFSASSASFRLRALQMQLGDLATEASRRRRRGEDEAEVLASARRLALRWRELRGAGAGRRSRARALYHFGETLRRRGESAGRRYLRDAVRADPALVRGWLRLVQATLLTARTPPTVREERQ